MRRDDITKFKRELNILSRASTEDFSETQVQNWFKRLRVFMSHIRKEGAGKNNRDYFLDVRKHIEITAVSYDSQGREHSTYAALGGKSGGETQELVAFIVGAALRFQLGDEANARPRFAPVFLDEGFIKADSEFAGRSVDAWKGLGFQLIIGAPEDKFTALEPHADHVLYMVKSCKGYSSVKPLAPTDRAGRTPADLLNDIRRRLDRTWATDLTGTTTSWPHRFPLGSTTKTELETHWQATYQPLVRQWRDWADEQPVRLRAEPKRVYSTTEDIPTHVEVDSAATAAILLGADWVRRLSRGRDRAEQAAERFPTTPDLSRIVRATDSYGDADFALILTVADWFRANDATGYTPRQVPIPGVHAKWLNTHQSLILALSGRETLGLLPRHPARIHFTYLDPDHRAAGARWHDCSTVGDAFEPPYCPEVVVISENKDTAIHFPAVAGGIAVEGEGFGGKTAASFPWLIGAPRLYYWGDIDKHGYEILNGWREDGVPVTSILMDADTYARYEPYGTNTDRNGVALLPGAPKLLTRLTTDERAMYERLVDPVFPTHRRIEQERIPLCVALGAI